MSGAARAAALLTAALCTITSACASAGGRTNTADAATTSGQSSKPVITQVTPSMLVERSSFPTLASVDWWQDPSVTPDASNSHHDLKAVPVECSEMRSGLGDGAHDQNANGTTGVAGYTSFVRTLTNYVQYSVALDVPLDGRSTDLPTLVDNCQAAFGREPELGYTIRRTVIGGLPPWAIAVQGEAGQAHVLMAVGRYRGVVVRVSANRAVDNRADAAAVAKLFNTEVDKLENT